MASVHVTLRCGAKSLGSLQYGCEIRLSRSGVALAWEIQLGGPTESVEGVKLFHKLGPLASEATIDCRTRRRLGTLEGINMQRVAFLTSMFLLLRISVLISCAICAQVRS